jgi:hypothetical protein
VGDVKATEMIVTIEGLSVGSSHPVQIAWAAVDVDAGRGGSSIPPQFCPVTNGLARRVVILPLDRQGYDEAAAFRATSHAPPWQSGRAW